MNNIFKKFRLFFGKNDNTAAEMIAALACFKIKLDRETFSRISETMPTESLKSNDVFFFKNGVPTVNREYDFSEVIKMVFDNNDSRIVDSLIALVENNLMSDVVLYHFIKDVIGINAIRSAAMGRLSENVFKAVADNETVVNCARKHHCLYKMNIAEAIINIRDNNRENDTDYCSELLSQVFRKSFCEAESSVYKVKIFLKIIMIASDYKLPHVPSAIIECLEDNYQIFLGPLKGLFLNNSRDQAAYERKHDDLLQNYGLEISNEIISHHRDFVPSHLLCGHICNLKGDYDQAEEYYKRASEMCFAGAISLVDFYNNRIAELLKGRYNRNELAILNKKLSKTFEEHCNLLEKSISEVPTYENITNYIVISAQKGRYEKNRGYYNSSYKTFSSILDNPIFVSNREIYRIYAELGILHQIKGKKFENPYYSIRDSILRLEQARTAFENEYVPEENKHGYKVLIMPLLNSYIINGDNDKAKDVIEIILSVYPNESKAKTALKRINEAAQVICA